CCFALGLLAGVRRRRLDLGELVAEQVQIPLSRTLAGAKLVQLSLQGTHLFVRRPVTLPALQVPGTREAVENLELGGGEHQPAMLVLAVERQESRSERTEVADGRTSSLDEAAGAASGADPAPEGDLAIRLRKTVREVRQLRIVKKAVREREHAFDVCLARARAHDLRLRLTAH